MDFLHNLYHIELHNQYFMGVLVGVDLGVGAGMIEGDGYNDLLAAWPFIT